MYGRGCCKVDESNGWYVWQGRWKIWEKFNAWNAIHKLESENIQIWKNKLLYICMTEITMIELLKIMKYGEILEKTMIHEWCHSDGDRETWIRNETFVGYIELKLKKDNGWKCRKWMMRNNILHLKKCCLIMQLRKISKESLINEWKNKLKAFQKTNDQWVELAIMPTKLCSNK